MGEATIIGVALAKAVFRVQGAAADGSVLFRRMPSRPQFARLIPASPAPEHPATADRAGKRGQEARSRGAGFGVAGVDTVGEGDALDELARLVRALHAAPCPGAGLRELEDRRLRRLPRERAPRSGPSDAGRRRRR
ncbi:MAG: hypothetical protein R6V44_04440 [Paracoccaceae bacterium]